MNAWDRHFADFQNRQRAIGHSPHTLKRLRLAFRIFLDYLEDHHIESPSVLTRDHLRGFQLALNERRTHGGGPMSAAYINTVLKGVRVFLDHLHEEGEIRRLAPALVYIREAKLLPRSVLTHAQVKKIFRKIDTTTLKGIRDRAVLELLYSSGIRLGELEGLRLPELDLDRATARVIGKGGKERFVPIGKTALKWLNNYLHGVRPFMPKTGTDAVFLNLQGGPLTRHTLYRRLKIYAAALDVDFPVTPHTFRRSCTTEMVKSNANLYHVKQLLGHESFETLNRYAKLNITDLQKTHAKCHPRERDER